MVDWREVVRPREERIMALTTRLELSRQALSGLQDKKGHRVPGIVGAIDFLKSQHSSGADQQQIEENFALALRVADLEALQLSLLEKENNELRQLYGELVALHDRRERQQATPSPTTPQASEDARMLAELQERLRVQEAGSARIINDLQERLQQQQQQQQHLEQQQKQQQQHDGSSSRVVADLQERLRAQTETLNAKSLAMDTQLYQFTVQVEELRSRNIELAKRTEAAEAEAHSAKSAAAGHAAAARNALSMHPNLERDISTYQNALNDAQHALKRSQEEHYELLARLEQLKSQGDTHALLQELRASQHENTMLRRRIDEQGGQGGAVLQAQQGAVLNQSELERLRREFSELEQRFKDELGRKNAALSERNLALREAEDLRHILMQERQQRLLGGSAQAQQQQQQLQQLQQQLMDHAAAEATLKHQLQDSAAAHSVLQAEQEERNAQIMREVDAVRELEQRVTEVTRELEQVREERDRQRTAVQQANSRHAELDELQMVSAVMSKELVQAKSQAASAAQRAEAMSKALKTLEVQRSDIAAQLETSRARQDDLALQVVTLQKEGAALQPQLVEARERAAQLVEELKNSERSAEHMKSVISSMKKDMTLHQSRNADADKELSALKAKYESLEVRYAQDRDQLVVKREELMSFETKLGAMARERDLLAGEKNELNDMVARLAGKLEEMNREIAKRQEIDAHASTVMARLQESNSKLKEDHDFMAKELSHIEEEKQGEKQLILSNLADTLAHGSDAEMAVRTMSDRLSQQTVEAREAVDKMQLLEDELRLLRSYAAERDAAVLSKESEFMNLESAQRTRLEDAETRLTIAAAAVKAKDAALMDAETRIAALEKKVLLPLSFGSGGGSPAKDVANSATSPGRALIVGGGEDVEKMKARVTELEKELREAKASERELREAALTKLQTSPRKMGYEMDGGGLDGARAEIAALLGQVEQLTDLYMNAKTDLAEYEAAADKIHGPRPALSAGEKKELMTQMRALEKQMTELEEEKDAKVEMLKRCEDVIQQQQKKVLAQEDAIQTLEKTFRALKDSSKSPEEVAKMKEEIATLTSHNTTMAQALKSMRDATAAGVQELKKKEDQLSAAISRAREIQAEKDEALALASESVGEVDTVRSRLDAVKTIAIKKILTHWRLKDITGAWGAWVQAWESSKTDDVLGELGF